MAVIQSLPLNLEIATTGIITLIVLILVLLKCVCGDKKKESSTENGHVKRKSNSRSSSKRENRENGQIAPSEELTPEEENGILQTSADAVRLIQSRPKSHDGNRALPEIPNGYDSGEGGLHHPYATMPGEQDSQTYAAVNDPDYAGISTDTASETYAAVNETVARASFNASRKTSAKVSQHAYAEVQASGEATYAQISEKPSSSKAFSLRTGTGRRQESERRGARAQISSTASNDTVYSLTNPPVPSKHPDLHLESSNPSNERGPRQGSLLDIANIPYADEGSPQHSMYDVEPGGASSSAASGRARQKEPPYGDITARESLSHIREREAREQEGATSMHTTASGYVKRRQRDYDEIQSVAAIDRSRVLSAPIAGLPGDRTSLSSDTYAEIQCATEQLGGFRSSMYAQVSDIDQHAPTPPPIDSLKQLSSQDGHRISSGEGSRPNSAYNSSHTQEQPIYSMPNKRKTVHAGAMGEAATKPDPKLEHLYSQVNKDRKSSKIKAHKTDSSYDNVNNEADAYNKDTEQDTNENVSRLRPNETTRGRSSSQDGARAGNGQGYNGGNSERGRGPGYQTIGSALDGVTGATIDDPDYDTVQEGAVVVIDGSDGYDLDYESLPGSAAAIAVRNPTQSNNTPGLNPTGDTNANPLTPPYVNIQPTLGRVTDDNSNQASGGGTAGASENGERGLIHVSQHRPRAQVPRQRREHIYEVISDSEANNGRENIYTAEPTRHVNVRAKSTVGLPSTDPCVV